MSARLSNDRRLAMLRAAAERAGVARASTAAQPDTDDGDDFGDVLAFDSTPVAAPDLTIEITDENGNRRTL